MSVRHASTLEAEVTPCAYQDEPAVSPADLIDGGRCEPVYLDFGSMRLKVAVDKKSGDNSKLETIERDLRELEKKPGALFIVVDPTGKPDWIVQKRDGRLMLLSADAARIEGELPANIPRFPLSEKEPAKSLKEYTARVFRAQSLLNLTAPGASIEPPRRGINGLATDRQAIDVEVGLVKLPEERATAGDLVQSEGREPVLPPGQWIGWQITNHSHFAVDVTLLFVDGEYGITAAYPRAGAGSENTLGAGRQIMPLRARTTPTLFGSDRIVVIAVKSEGQPVDFSVLQQPSLPAARATLRGAGDPTLESPLGALCQAALYGKGKTRGSDLRLTNYKMDLISWRVAEH